MLEHVPAWLGGLLKSVRAGHARLVIADEALALPDPSLSLSSPAFADGARLPDRFTADGDGVSPPLVWGPAPEGTAAFALIVEDPDAPAPQPLVHAVVWAIRAGENGLAEGAMVADGDGNGGVRDVGRNSYGREGWLPPDPPTGHGSHDYVFQLFALSEAVSLPGNPGRSAVVEALTGRVLATGLLVGTYSRGEPAEVGPAGSPAIA